MTAIAKMNRRFLNLKKPIQEWDPWSLMALPLLLFIILPLIAILARTSLAQILLDLKKPLVLQAISLSLFTSSITTLVTFVFGLPVAYLLAQKKGRIYHLVDTLVDLPMVLPPAVAGVALLMAFGRRGLMGEPLAALGISIPFTQFAVIMAQTFVAAPYFIKAAAAGFSAVSAELKQAAALDGAGSWQVFWHLGLPLAGFSLLSGSVMTWARALGEFGATIIFAGNFPGRTQTMPLAIYIGFEIELQVALTLALILLCTSFVTLALVKGILRSRVSAIPD